MTSTKGTTMRWRRLTWVIAIVSVGAVLTATHAQAIVSDGPCSASATGDFNGDGFADLAVGVPEEDIGAVPDAGAVNVIYGSGGGLTAANNQFWHQNVFGVNGSNEAGDRFGACLAVGNFNGDTNGANSIDDLAIGVPGEDLDGIVNAGAVNVIYGSKSSDGRLSSTQISDQIWHQNYPGIADVTEAGDAFGGALAAGDFNADGEDDLAFGVPLENIGTKTDAGAVHVVYGSEAGLHPTADQFWHQDVAGIEGIAEPGDRFGSALTSGLFNDGAHADLAIGEPGEDVGALVDAGAVNVIYGSATRLSATGDQIWTQSSTGVSDDAEAGDLFGRSLAAGNFGGTGHQDLAIGVPGEDLTSPTRADAGGVNVIPGAAAKLVAVNDPLVTQDVILSTADTSEAGDAFGSSLVAADFGEDSRADLAIGAPFEDEGATNAGAVDVLYATAAGLNLAAGAPAADFWQQGVGGVENTRTADDAFGASLAAGDFNNAGAIDLVVGVPLEDVSGAATNDGAVNVIYGLAAGGLDTAGPPVDQIIWQGATSPIGALVDDGLQAQDMFGSAA